MQLHRIHGLPWWLINKAILYPRRPTPRFQIQFVQPHNLEQPILFKIAGKPEEAKLSNSSNHLDSNVDFNHFFYLPGMPSFCASWSLCDDVYFSYTCVDRGPWGEKMGQRMGGLNVWLVRAAILRICPSWDNASPHTIFKHSGGQRSNTRWTL